MKASIAVTKITWYPEQSGYSPGLAHSRRVRLHRIKTFAAYSRQKKYELRENRSKTYWNFDDTKLHTNLTKIGQKKYWNIETDGTVFLIWFYLICFELLNDCDDVSIIYLKNNYTKIFYGTELIRSVGQIVWLNFINFLIKLCFDFVINGFFISSLCVRDVCIYSHSTL